MQRVWIAIGSLAGLGAVAMAAFAAHGTDALDVNRVGMIRNAVQMQGWHALALIGCGLWAPRGGAICACAGAAFTLGLLLFCGAVYALGIEGAAVGAFAPVGGTLLMLGWLLLFASALRPR
jgi:uncharacterized membrane protein YgdD (TMEM256/DUF423 family)